MTLMALQQFWSQVAVSETRYDTELFAEMLLASRIKLVSSMLDFG